MRAVEYQRSMGSHTTAIGAHETSFHCIGEDIHVIHSSVVDTEFGIDIETIRGWLYVRHSRRPSYHRNDLSGPRVSRDRTPRGVKTRT